MSYGLGEVTQSLQTTVLSCVNGEDHTYFTHKGFVRLDKVAFKTFSIMPGTN